MLDTLSKLARTLNWLKPVAYLLVIGSLSLLINALFFTPAATSDVYLIPSVLGFIWSLLLISMLLIFPGTPAKAIATDKFFRRFKIRIIRGFYFLVASLFVCLNLVIIILSFKMLGIWQDTY